MATETKKKENEGFQYDGYLESDAVKQAQAMLQQQLAQKPGAYQSQWQQQLSDTMDKILNREQFSYDINGDALYSQYKDLYTTQGKMAMMDTMAQAQAMTGGYGNSYAQNAGQQAYQGYLQGLNDRIPELYQLALSRYQLEGDQLANRYSLLQAQENQDYGRYQDSQNAWLAERDYLAGRYDAERNYDYGVYSDDRNFAWQKAQAIEAQRQWQAEFDEAQRQYDQDYALQQAQAAARQTISYRLTGDEDLPNDSTVVPSYDSIVSELNKKVSDGDSKSSVSKFIRDAQSAGDITSAQAATLRKTYLQSGAY